MTMGEYVKEVTFAVTLLINGIWREQRAIKALRKKIKELEPVVRSEYQVARSIQESAEDADDVMLGVGRYWENYFGPDKQMHKAGQRIQLAKARLISREFSVGSLASAVLQHA